MRLPWVRPTGGEGLRSQTKGTGEITQGRWHGWDQTQKVAAKVGKWHPEFEEVFYLTAPLSQILCESHVDLPQVHRASILVLW